MATGGASSTDIRTTCSVCLEPYSGPALLPCKHTVCPACFQSLVRLQNQQLADVGDKSREDMVTAVSCPVCRKVSTVSNPGDTDLQKNLCIEKPDSRQILRTACDLCDEGRDAVVWCTKCQENICLQCRRFHDKYNEGHVVMIKSLSSEPDGRDDVRDNAEEQVKILASAMARLEEEEKELWKQGRELEEDINARWSAGLLEMAKARDKCVSDLKALVRAHEIRLQKEKAYLADKHADLKSALSLTRDYPSAGPSQLLQAALLGDEVSNTLQKRLANVTPSRYVIYTKTDCRSFQSSTQEFMGFVLSSEDEVRPKNVLSLDSPLQKDENCTDDRNVCLQMFVPDAKAIVDDMENADSRDIIGTSDATNTTDSKFQMLVDKVDKLVAQLDDVKNENKVLQTQMLSLQDLCHRQNADYRGEYMNMMQEVTRLKAGNSSVCQEMSSLRDKESELRQYGEKLKGDISRLQTDWETSRTLFLGLRQEVDNLSKDRARHQDAMNGMATEFTASQGRLSQLELKLSKAAAETRLSSLRSQVVALKSSHNQVPALQRTTALLQKEQSSLASKIEKYSFQMKTLERTVAYHAILSTNVTLSSDQVLIADHVITNTGGAYDRKTGVFTAPVFGIYIFFATICSAKGLARVDLVADNVRKAHAYAANNALATCHAMLDLDSGQKIFLRTFDSDSATFGGGWRTTFSGSLLKSKN